MSLSKDMQIIISTAFVDELTKLATNRIDQVTPEEVMEVLEYPYLKRFTDKGRQIYRGVKELSEVMDIKMPHLREEMKNSPEMLNQFTAHINTKNSTAREKTLNLLDELSDSSKEIRDQAAHMKTKAIMEKIKSPKTLAAAAVLGVGALGLKALSNMNAPSHTVPAYQPGYSYLDTSSNGYNNIPDYSYQMPNTYNSTYGY